MVSHLFRKRLGETLVFGATVTGWIVFGFLPSLGTEGVGLPSDLRGLVAAAEVPAGAQRAPRAHMDAHRPRLGPQNEAPRLIDARFGLTCDQGLVYSDQ